MSLIDARLKDWECSKLWQWEPEFVWSQLLKCRYSPIKWKAGTRKSDNFEKVECIVIDVDDGAPLYKTLEILQGICCLVGTTKSHQKDKKGKICDRYRVVLPLIRPITDKQEYEATQIYWIEKLGGDMATKDLARMYAPCTEIVWDSLHELVLISPIAPTPKQVKKEELKNQKMTAWLLKHLTIGFYSAGNRNHTIYGVAREMKKHNFSLENAIETIANRTDLKESEVKTIVRSAYSK